MEFDQAKIQYDILSSKYKFNNISFKQVNTYEEIDELINNINSISNEIKQRKCFDYKSNMVYLNKKLLNFCNKNTSYGIFNKLREESLPKQIEMALFRTYEYYVTKFDQTEKEVYDDVKIIAETNNRVNKRVLINNFIKKWTQKDKVIDITL